MYRLLVFGATQQWEDVDLGDDAPAMNYTSVEIPKVEKNNVTYSQELKLPLTSRNKILFGFSDEIDQISYRTPYEKIPCRLFSNDVEVAGEGSFINLRGVADDKFSCQILSGTADFFTIMKDKKMKDIIDLGRWTYNTDTLVNNNFPVDKDDKIANYNFFLCSNIKGIAKNAPDDAHKPNQIYLNTALPFVRVKYLLEKLINAQGFQLGYNSLTNDDIFKNAYVSTCSHKMDQDSFSVFNAEARVPHGRVTEPKSHKAYLFDITDSGNGKLVNNTNMYIFNSPYSIVYKAPTNCDLEVHVSIDIDKKTFDPNLETLWLDYISSVYNYQDNVKQILHHTIKKDTQVGLGLGIHGGFPSYANMHTLVDATVKFKPSKCDLNIDIPINATIPFNINLGFDNQIDLFKSLISAFGLVAIADNINHKVNLISFRELINNATKYVDWSDKFDVANNPKINFYDTQYAKNNHLKFKDNSGDNVKDSGILKIDNCLLSATDKDIISLGFEAGYDQSYPTKDPLTTLANLPYTAKDGENGYKLGDGKPHLVQVQNKISTDVTIYDENNKKQDSNPTYIGVSHLNGQTLVDNYYAELQNNLLADIKYVEVKLNINDRDVAEFDQFRPVFINRLGALFFVNKIKNYVAGKLTTCELYRILITNKKIAPPKKDNLPLL